MERLHKLGWLEGCLWGIVAYGFGYTQKNCTIKNCLNADALTTGDGTYQFIHIGGIAGSVSQNVHVSNCVSTGRITEDADKTYIGT